MKFVTFFYDTEHPTLSQTKAEIAYVIRRKVALRQAWWYEREQDDCELKCGGHGWSTGGGGEDTWPVMYADAWSSMTLLLLLMTMMMTTRSRMMVTTYDVRGRSTMYDVRRRSTKYDDIRRRRRRTTTTMTYDVRRSTTYHDVRRTTTKYDVRLLRWRRCTMTTAKMTYDVRRMMTTILYADADDDDDGSEFAPAAPPWAATARRRWRASRAASWPSYSVTSPTSRSPWRRHTHVINIHVMHVSL